MLSSNSFEIFVPIIHSLSDDAPGYNASSQQSNFSESLKDSSDRDTNLLGPICWKCDGKGVSNVKNKIVVCKVCHGVKRLEVKKSLQNIPKGLVTKRTYPSDWLEQNENEENSFRNDPDLMPKDGEQLCGLVGNWRIFQHYGGHRWTTDDIVTAWVAMKVSRTYSVIIKELLSQSRNSPHNIQPTDTTPSTAAVTHYLDLGCGNGSVLMMVSKHLPESTLCIGIEARSEAVGLARRSIKYNCGVESTRITIRNHDFREIYNNQNSDTTNSVDSQENSKVACSNTTEQNALSTTCNEKVLPEGAIFDLITGTPPYFRVNFKVDTQTQCVEQALIRQGGMPTCKESAPARCEFRGGIEAYCLAAMTALSAYGVFIVCENYLNHDRVLQSAKETGLYVLSVQRVIGKEGKVPLFCVYTMIRQSLRDQLVSVLAPLVDSMVASTSETEDTTTTIVVAAYDSATNIASGAVAQHHHIDLLSKLTRTDDNAMYASDLTVRDNDGAWTVQYAEMLREISYPVVSLHPSGRY